jgi:hypothetical protein
MAIAFWGVLASLSASVRGHALVSGGTLPAVRARPSPARTNASPMFDGSS